MYIPGDYVLPLLTLTPMIPPTAVPTTDSTTLNHNSISLPATTHQPGVCSKRAHHPRDPLLIIPTDLPCSDDYYDWLETHMCLEASCLDPYKDIKFHMLHEASHSETYKGVKSHEERKLHDDIEGAKSLEGTASLQGPKSPKEAQASKEPKPNPPPDTTLPTPAYNTHPRSTSTLGPSPEPLPGNLTSCPPAELIFARGMGEPSGLGRIGTALYIQLLKEYPGMTAYGVFYDASAYKGKLISDGRLEKASKDVKGRVRMWVALERQCRETRIVLGGFSLGEFCLKPTYFLEPE